MTAPPALVIFDCDGVLVETEETSSRVMEGALARVGITVQADAFRRTYKGWPLGKIQAALEEQAGQPMPAGWLDDFIAERLEVFRAEGVEPIPGAPEALAALREAGIPFCVASQGTHQKMAVTLEASGMSELLAGARIFSADEVPRGKPFPDLYLHAAAELGQPPAQSVVIEDSATGVQGGRAAGMRVLAYAVDADPAALLAAGGELFYDLFEVPERLGLL
jgi:HAD superfamily hydrolase (TIGR01509 family)